MKKILLLLKADHYKAGILDFAASICAPEKATLVGVFIEHTALESQPSIKTIGGQYFVEEIVQDPNEQKHHNEEVRTNMKLFRDGCTQREIRHFAHLYKGNQLQHIIEETRYADAIIVDPSTSLSDDNKVPSKFIMDILSESECPVMIAPEYFEKTEEVVFAFDGSKSSMRAIKQFIYLMPEFSGRNIHVLHISDEGETGRNDTLEVKQFTEWLNMHFNKISFINLKGNPREMLFSYFMDNNDKYNKMLISGAYGRTLLSTFFKPSTADLVLKAVDIPMFIYHG